MPILPTPLNEKTKLNFDAAQGKGVQTEALPSKIFNAIKKVADEKNWSKAILYQVTKSFMDKMKAQPGSKPWPQDFPKTDSFNLNAPPKPGSPDYAPAKPPYSPPDITPGSSFSDVKERFSYEYSNLKNNTNFDHYSKELKDAYRRLADVRQSEDKFISTKEFKRAINELNNSKYTLRPKLIEQYKAQGLDAITIEKMISAETSSIDNEIDSLDQKWQDQLREYKNSIESRKDDIALLTSQIQFALQDVANGYRPVQDAADMFNSLQKQSDNYAGERAKYAKMEGQFRDEDWPVDFLYRDEYIEKNPNSLYSISEHYLGTKYSWGGKGPAGYDCSGLVAQLMNDYYGVKMVTEEGGAMNADMLMQSDRMFEIGNGPPRAGDLIFWHDPTVGVMEGHATHVGIYDEFGYVTHTSPTNKNGGVARDELNTLQKRWPNITELGIKRLKDEYKTKWPSGESGAKMSMFGGQVEVPIMNEKESTTEYKIRLSDWFVDQAIENADLGTLIDKDLYMTAVSSKSGIPINDLMEEVENKFRNLFASRIDDAFPGLVARYGEDPVKIVYDLWTGTAGMLEINDIITFAWDDLLEPMAATLLNLDKTDKAELEKSVLEYHESEMAKKLGSIDTSNLDEKTLNDLREQYK